MELETTVEHHKKQVAELVSWQIHMESMSPPLVYQLGKVTND